MKRFIILAIACVATLLLASTFASAADQPYLLITSVPKYGNAGGVLKGKVFSDDGSKIRMSDYRVMLYLELEVEDHAYSGATPSSLYVGYPKPYYKNKYSRLSKSGAFSVDVTTGGYDRYALSYTVLLVTADRNHTVVDMQRVIRYHGRGYAYSIDPRSYRQEPASLKIPAIKMNRMSVRAGKTARLPTIDGYEGGWVVQDQTAASVLGGTVRGLSAHKKTALVFTVSEVLNPSRRVNGKILGVGDQISVDLFVTCPLCANQKLRLTRINATVRMGKRCQIKVEGKHPCTWQTALTYRSSNELVATVDGQGLITPVKPGRVSITATNVFGFSKTLKLRILPAK